MTAVAVQQRSRGMAGTEQRRTDQRLQPRLRPWRPERSGVASWLSTAPARRAATAKTRPRTGTGGSDTQNRDMEASPITHIQGRTPVQGKGQGGETGTRPVGPGGPAGSEWPCWAGGRCRVGPGVGRLGRHWIARVTHAGEQTRHPAGVDRRRPARSGAWGGRPRGGPQLTLDFRVGVDGGADAVIQCSHHIIPATSRHPGPSPGADTPAWDGSGSRDG
jgi:hypothetical protein